MPLSHLSSQIRVRPRILAAWEIGGAENGELRVNEQDQLIAVGSFSQPLEAYLIQSMLDSEGIESILEGEDTIAANPLFSNAIGGVRVRVLETDVERAAQIIEKYHDERAESDAIRARTCPECNCGEGIPVRHVGWLGLLSVITSGAFALLLQLPKYKCPNCMHKWH